MKQQRTYLFILVFFFLGVISCKSEIKPQLIIYGKDVCAHCHMVISDQRFGAQIVTAKGKVFAFDSVNCLHGYSHSHSLQEHRVFFIDSLQKDHWLPAEETIFIPMPQLRSPMGAGLFSGKSSDAKNLILNATDKHYGVRPTISLTNQGTMTWDQLEKELSAGKFK